MEYCPFSGSPCPYDKVYKVTDVSDNKAIQTNYMCHEGCGGIYIEALFRPSCDKISIKVNKQDPVDIPINKQKAIEKAPQVITSVQELFELFTGKGIRVEKPIDIDPGPCPICDLTLAQFNHEGRFGCSHCYVHYLEEFLALAGPFQEGEEEHRGKIPTHYKKGTTLEEQIRFFKLNIARAIEIEDYEKAEMYKKQLDLLKGENPEP